jgi:hypothetical protein
VTGPPSYIIFTITNYHLHIYITLPLHTIYTPYTSSVILFTSMHTLDQANIYADERLYGDLNRCFVLKHSVIAH